MPLDPDKISEFLDRSVAQYGAPSSTIVAFSGGRDSTVLLSLMADLAPRLQTALSAVHVNHALQTGADEWQTHCAQFAAALNVPFRAISVAVQKQGDAGPEGNARQARYAALAELLGDGDWLMTGHHEDDQAETVLLNLMRGSGVTGLRGMLPCRDFERGLLVRPLLSYSAAEIADFAARRKLSWIDDLSNSDTTFDRNFLRHEVLPVLQRRWPAASRQLAHSAQLAAAAAAQLEELAVLDIARCGTSARLSVSALTELSGNRLGNVLRHACQLQGLPVPPRHQLAAIIADVLPAKPDATPLVSWPGGEARRFRD
ncbi:MAG: tRNA lysidine(34) synthetase TilS, partial [Woeseia sp.]|nr:tRNA lysidine(34) synthetase TilS [Woeseia sp.]